MPIVVATTYYVVTTPEHRREAGQALDRRFSRLFQTSEPGGSEGGADDDSAKSPALPTGLVGDQGNPLAGPNKNGSRHTSGGLRPELWTGQPFVDRHEGRSILTGTKRENIWEAFRSGIG